MIIRFRLYSDQLAAGWGWAIDNLYIQDPITRVENNLESSVDVYPNPAKESITILAEGISSASARIQLMNPQGQSVYAAQAPAENGKLSYTIPATTLPRGVYFVKISNRHEIVTRKIVLTD